MHVHPRPPRLLITRNLSAQPQVHIKRAPTPPVGAKISSIKFKMFPMSYKQSWSEWWTRKSVDETEKQLLKTVGITTSGPGAVANDLKVPVGPGGLEMSELEFVGKPIDNQPNKHVVLVHGYGAAKGFFYQNFVPLAMPGYTLHALDWLGYGRSSRPNFSITPRDRVEGVHMAENFFVDSLEEWRQQRGIDDFTLIAHSLGAYCGAAYALAHPDRVNKLMMVSPAAIMRHTESLPFEKVGTERDPEIPIAEPKFNVPRWFRWGWERNISPFSLVRNTGPLGPKFVSGWTSRRFAAQPEAERLALHDYSYSIFNAKGSGEYALNYLLAPGASARWPMAERISPIKVPTLWVYGDGDWMDIRGGKEAARQIRKAGGPEARVVEVENAGHHLYLDNVSKFNKLAQDFIRQPVEQVKESFIKEVPV